MLDTMCLFVFLNFPVSLLLPSLRRGKRQAFPVSHMWSGYKKEELLEAAHGDSHRFKKSSVSALSVPMCSQGQSQIPHEGKSPADRPEGEAGAARALAPTGVWAQGCKVECDADKRIVLERISL